ncbi:MULTISPECIES: PqqD family protein [unclassified Microbacterium]|uniref:PqqD family protein n=1 Tax=unclassified Microbacterium TaxID=2609290 RepID=UPI0012F73A3A|nr:PqqD family peptide modification chaperone [Microbacterium sp. MAH-37]
MGERIVISAVGVSVEIDMAELDEAVREQVAEAWRDARLPDGRHVDVTVPVAASDDTERTLSNLSTQVTLAALAHRKGDLWMLHAAGLADERGHVVVLAAPSGTGKTTAARHLSARYAYVSDETVGVDSQGGIVAYRKPLSVIQPDRVHKEQIPPSQFEGGEWPQKALRLSALAVLERDPAAPEQPEVTPLTTAEALEALGPQSSYLCDLRDGLHLLEALLRATGGAVRIRYREASSLDDAIASLLDREPPFAPVVPTYEAPAPDRVTDAGERLYRGAVVDAMELPDDGRIAVLQRSSSGGRLSVLDGIAPAIWRAANGATFDELVTAVTDAIGAPPEGADAADLVRVAADELRTSGMLAGEPCWRLDPRVAWTDGDDRTVVLGLADPQAQPLALERSAHAVWQVLSSKGAVTQGELLREVAEAFDVEPAEIEGDVVDLLEGLRVKRVVEYC